MSIHITSALISMFPSLHKTITYRTGENGENPQDHGSEFYALPRPPTSDPPQSEPPGCHCHFRIYCPKYIKIRQRWDFNLGTPGNIYSLSIRLMILPLLSIQLRSTLMQPQLRPGDELNTVSFKTGHLAISWCITVTNII